MLFRSGRDDRGALGDAALQAFALDLGLGQGTGEVDVALLITTEVHLQVGHVGASAGHLALGNQDILAGAPEALLGLHELTERGVEKHINAIFSKLHLVEEPDVNRRVTAVLMYLSDGGGADHTDPHVAARFRTPRSS